MSMFFYNILTFNFSDITVFLVVELADLQFFTEFG